MDRVSKKKRSKMMRAMKSENTGPEMAIRSSLYKMGYRYRLHIKELPGTPDVVLPKYGAVIFVNGCFWHQHGCDRTTMPKTRKKFWKDKFEKNKERDRKNKTALEKMGWKVIVVWECDLADDIEGVTATVDGILKKRSDNKIKLGKQANDSKKKSKKKKNAKYKKTTGHTRRRKGRAGGKGTRRS